MASRAAKGNGRGISKAIVPSGAKKTSKNKLSPQSNETDTEATFKDEAFTASTEPPSDNRPPESGINPRLTKNPPSKRKSGSEDSGTKTSNKKKRISPEPKDEQSQPQPILSNGLDEHDKEQDFETLRKDVLKASESAKRTLKMTDGLEARLDDFEKGNINAPSRIKQLEKENGELRAQNNSINLELKQTKEELKAAKLKHQERGKRLKKAIAMIQKQQTSRENSQGVAERTKAGAKAHPGADVTDLTGSDGLENGTEAGLLPEIKQHRLKWAVAVIEAHFLRRQNDQYEDTIDALRQQIDDLGNQLADRYLSHEKVCDDTITKAWYELTNLIRQTVPKCLQSLPLIEREALRNNEYAEGIFRFVQQMKHRSSGYQMHCFQGYIWRRLQKDVFFGAKASWAGPVATTFLAFCRDLSRVGGKNVASAELMSSIKSETAHRIDEHFEFDEEAFELYIDGFVQDMSVFVAQDTQIGSLRERLWKIVRGADKLRVMMMKSKALFSVAWPPYEGKALDSIEAPRAPHPCFWEQTTEHKEPTVLYTVCPELWKCGFADGHSFEIKALLAQAVVVVSYPKNIKEEGEQHVVEKTREPAPAKPIANGGQRDPFVVSDDAREEGDEDSDSDSNEESTDGDNGSNYSTDVATK